MKKKILFLLPALALLLGACNQPTPSEESSESQDISEVEVVESVTLDKATAEVAVDEYVTLLATVTPYTVDSSVLWTSSDPTIASVNDSGRVKGVSVGEATITATSVVDSTKSASCVVTVIAEAQPISIAEALAAEDGTLVLVRGIVKEINTKWSTEYNNITVTIIDEALDELYVYRLGTKVEVGDDITVSGEMATYNGNRQVAQGATAVINSSGNEIPGGAVTYTEMTLAEAKAAEDGTYAKVRGIVKTIDGAWNSGYGNMNVTIIDEALTELYIYRLATQVEVGDDITIEGKVSSYEGAKQIIEGTATIHSSGNDIPGGIEYIEMTIAEVLAAEDGTLVKVTGDVKAIDPEGEWSEQYKNMSVTITDGTNDLYVYRLGTKVAVGDNITIEGKVSSYEGAKQIAQGATAVINTTGSGEGEGEGEGDDPTPTEMTIAEALAAADNTRVIVRGIVKNIGIAWDDEYENISVTIIDENLDELYIFRMNTKVAVGDDITVTGTMTTYYGSRQIAQGSTAVINSSGNEVPAPTGVILDIFASTGTYDATAKEISWSKDGVTFVNRKTSTSNDIRTSDTDHFRMYQGSTFEVTADAGVSFKTVTIFCTSASYAEVLKGSVDATSGTVTVDGARVIISVTGTSVTGTLTAQARINSVVVA